MIASIVLAVLSVYVYATNSIAQRIEKADPSVCLSRFVDYPNCFRSTVQKSVQGALGTPHPALSTHFWLKDVDFSCASPWCDESGSVRAGTLITKRHIIFAKHFPLWKGCRVLFVDKEGEVCPCRVKATKALAKGDIMIGSLDYEVTPNIHPAKVLPVDYEKYIGDGKGLPIVTFNQREEALLTECSGIETNYIGNAASTNVSKKALSKRIRTGDSGNPAFLLVGNEPILVYCLFSGGVGHGSPIHYYRAEIQRAMDELCPGYALEPFDFSSFEK